MPRSAQSESEWQTRRERVDPLLQSAGWKIVPFDPSRPTARYQDRAVTEYPSGNGPADYVLYVIGQPLVRRRKFLPEFHSPFLFNHAASRH
jgi:type I site-specific restriction endonuclease